MPPIGAITAAVPIAPASLNRSRSSIKTSPSSVSRPSRSFARNSNDRFVTLGKIESDFGVTNLSSLVMPKKFAEPASSILVWVAGSR